MRPDHDVDRALGEPCHDLLLLSLRREAAESIATSTGNGAEPLVEGAIVLLRQNGGRDQHGHLLAVLHGLEGGAQGDLGLAKADVAADQPIHRPAAEHVALHLLDGALLVGCLAVGECLFQLALPDRVRREAEARRRLPGGVDLEQLLRQLGHRPADPSLGALPVSAAQLAEGGPGATRVAAYAADLVRRQEDLVLSGEVELQVLLDIAAVLALRHAGIAGDAVVDVDQQVAGLQLADQIASDDPLGRGQAPDAGRAEQFAIGQDHQAQRLVDETAGERAMDQADGAGRRGLAQLRHGRSRQARFLQQLADAAGLVGADHHSAAAHLVDPGAQAIEPARQQGRGGVAGVGSRVGQ